MSEPCDTQTLWDVFATQFISCLDKGSPADIDENLELHMELCRPVEERRKVLDDIDVLEPSSLQKVRCHGNFECMESFRAVVIVIDKTG